MEIYIISDCSDQQLDYWIVGVGLKQISESRNIKIFKGINCIALTTEQDQWLRSKHYEKIFESCYIPSKLPSNLRSKFVKLLFSAISCEEYDASITHSINIGCYEKLFECAVTLSETKKTNVLDVGCGPGTILETRVANIADTVTGYDFISANLDAASERGLRVIYSDQIKSLNNESFDIILSVFLLHYQSLTDEALGILIRSLAIGGIWAGNFHKDIGVDWFTDLLVRQNFYIFKEVPSIYGTLVFAKRTM